LTTIEIYDRIFLTIKEKELLNMKVLVLSNGELKAQDIGEGLEELQKIVGGYIEIPFLGHKFSCNNIDVIINEEGKLIGGLKPEIAVVNEERGNILDIVYGNCIFASHDEDGNTVGLTKEQMQIVMEELETVIELMNRRTLEEYEVRALFI
jgi:hypothetical protein